MAVRPWWGPGSWNEKLRQDGRLEGVSRSRCFRNRFRKSGRTVLCLLKGALTHNTWTLRKIVKPGVEPKKWYVATTTTMITITIKRIMWEQRKIQLSLPAPHVRTPHHSYKWQDVAWYMRKKINKQINKKKKRKKKKKTEILDVSSFTHLCTPFRRSYPPASEIFLRLFPASRSRNPSIRFALMHPCASRSVQASTIYSYRFLVSALRVFLRGFASSKGYAPENEDPRCKTSIVFDAFDRAAAATTVSRSFHRADQCVIRGSIELFVSFIKIRTLKSQK